MLHEIRRMVEFFGALGKETRRQDGRGSQEAREDASLAEALADRTKVVKLVVDKCFVDTGYGFGRGSSNEIFFIHASAVHGAEFLTIGTDVWA